MRRTTQLIESISRVRKFLELRHPAVHAAFVADLCLALGLPGRLAFLSHEAMGQVIQRGLSVADRCRQHNKVCHSRVRARLPVCLNEGAHQYRR